MVRVRQGKNKSFMRFCVITILAILPILEILAFINVSDRIGSLNTISITIFTTFIGILLFRFQGVSILDTMKKNIPLDRFLIEIVFDKLCLLFAAFMLLIPGFITDAIGTSMLLPPMKFLLKTIVTQSIKKYMPMDLSKKEQSGTPDTNIIDGEFQDITKNK
jgi:UPF0716 protein FxsA